METTRPCAYPLIGIGLQHAVYQGQPRRVLKRPTTTLEKVRILWSWGIRNPLKILRSVISANQTTQQSITGLKARLCDANRQFFGEPVFTNPLSYHQDSAVTLLDYFSAHLFAENQTIVDAYITHMFAMWSCGIADTVFNFTVNHGVTSSGSVIIVDLGELTFSKETIADLIRERTWERQWSLKTMPDSELKTYILDQMRSRITVANLETRWNTTD